MNGQPMTSYTLTKTENSCIQSCMSHRNRLKRSQCCVKPNYSRLQNRFHELLGQNFGVNSSERSFFHFPVHKSMIARPSSSSIVGDCQVKMFLFTSYCFVYYSFWINGIYKRWRLTKFTGAIFFEITPNNHLNHIHSGKRMRIMTYLISKAIKKRNANLKNRRHGEWGSNAGDIIDHKNYNHKKRVSEARSIWPR